jgi:hypothetical protein
MIPVRTVICAAIAWSASAGLASAQEWFPRLDFGLHGQYVATADPRFNWMFTFAGDVDAYRRDSMRAVFIAEYEAGAGEQFRRFDVNQGNYLLEGVLLFRVRAVEIGPVWHHVSRHLSDRPKRFPIDWNMLALRIRGVHGEGRLDAEWRADARVTVTNVYVDYAWEVDTAVRAVHSLTPQYGLVVGGSFRLVGVDDTRDRGAQAGARIEAGVRLAGTAAAAELFIGGERRIDPYPVEFGGGSWFLAGLRVTTR